MGTQLYEPLWLRGSQLQELCSVHVAQHAFKYPQLLNQCINAYNTHTHLPAESAQAAIFTSWALALYLRPNIAQMFHAFDV